EIDLAESEAHFIPIGDASPPIVLEAGRVITLTYTGDPLDALDANGTVISFPLTNPNPAGGSQQPQIQELSSLAATISPRLYLLNNIAPIPGTGLLDQEFSNLTVAAVGGATPDQFDPFGPLSYNADDQSRKFGYNYRL